MDGTNWVSVPTLKNGAFDLSGLAENANYTIYLRVKAGVDGNYLASDAVSTNFITPTKFSVAYHANYGTGTVPASVTQNSGSTVTVASCSGLKRTGYTFNGWNTQSGGTGTAYAAGSAISTGAILYAQWTANEYTVKFNANNGIGTIADQSLTCGKAHALTANSFVKIGWHFAGWATSTNGPVAYVDKQFVKNLAPGGSVTLYAVWTENQYSISGNIHSDSGSEVSVKLMRGSAQTETTQIVTMGGVGPYAGSYSFIGVPAGTYNIVATQGHKTITELIAVTDKDKTADITMPSGGVNSLLKVEGEDTHPVMVGGLKDEAQTKAETGKTVTVTMTVEKKEEQQCPETVGDAAQKT